MCAGYARAFQYIMTNLEIPTFYVTGYSNGEHAWNIVNLSDGCYNVDLLNFLLFFFNKIH